MTLHDRLKGVHKKALEGIKFEYPTTYKAVKEVLQSTNRIEDITIETAYDLYKFCGGSSKIYGVYGCFTDEEISESKSG